MKNLNKRGSIGLCKKVFLRHKTLDKIISD